jgi:hypothetical protein
MEKKIGLAVGVIAIILAGCGLKLLHDEFTVELPKYPPIGNAVWLDQNWTADQRDWFHHADQGTQTFGIPYEWFMALEQPALSFRAPGLLSDPLYLDRYGFIPSDTTAGKPGLPIGFSQGGPMRRPDGTPWRNPGTNVNLIAVGLTCAACHTGRLTYQKTTLLIDGAPALLNLEEFQRGVALSLLYTLYVPSRFNRFADRVLGTGASSEAKSDLRKQLDQIVSQVRTIKGLEDKVKHQTVKEGYARLDALNRIGNTVFAVDLLNSANFNSTNFVGYSAPVHFPRIWNASWFKWVQYNGSIEQPMTRNAGEALGVLAQVNLTGGKDRLFSSGVQVETLYELERLLAGATPPDAHSGFSGLTSPKWPATILPPIDTGLVAKGAGLYKELCQSCHMAPVTDAGFWASDRWSSTNSAGERYLNLEQIDIKHIGTDPAQAEDMKNRRVVTPPSLGIDSDQFGVALGQVVDKTVMYWYDSQNPPIPEAMREQMNGNRQSDVRALLSYKVRALNGIWATPPYLHNGSVPNLYALLSPVAERPKKFYLGNREYDPVNVGYRVDKFPGGFAFDTTIRGNSNSGHEFTDNPNKSGVIGRQLSPDERRALIEYLKTL